MPEIANVHLGELSELDETFVLDCYKGKLLGDDASSPENPVNMGKSKKSGTSNEYVCICTDNQRKGDVYAVTVNRTKPDAEELSTVFANHIADATLVLCDGLRSYNTRSSIVNCTVKDCT